MDVTFATRKTLLRKVKDQSDVKSWDEFIHFYRRYIYVVARNMNLNHHDAEDITQRALVKLWDKIPDFDYDRCRGTFRSWLCTIIRNMVINFVKKKSRMLTCLDHDEKNSTVKYLNNVSVTDLDAIVDKEWRNFLMNSAWNSIKESLNDNMRDVFLAFNKGLTLQQIAQKFDLKENTAYVYRLRVEEKLSKAITKLETSLG